MSNTIYKLAVPANVNEVAQMSAIDIYPNPSTGYVQVDVEGAITVSVCDIQGRQVYRNDIGLNERTHKVDAGQLPAGVYTITIVLTDGGTRSGKFVKE
jgi:hypothetical protein